MKRSVAEPAIGKLRSGYQCSIVGCSFVTNDIKQLEAHFCVHESLDVGDSAHQMHEVSFSESVQSLFPALPFATVVLLIFFNIKHFVPGRREKRQYALFPDPSTLITSFFCGP